MHIQTIQNNNNQYQIILNNTKQYQTNTKQYHIIPNNTQSIYLKLPENDPKVRRPDINLANNILNWKPKINLNDGLTKTINYFKNYS